MTYGKLTAHTPMNIRKEAGGKFHKIIKFRKMLNIKTRINGLRSEDIATVGMRVLETVEQSVAEELKKSLLVT